MRPDVGIISSPIFFQKRSKIVATIEVLLRYFKWKQFKIAQKATKYLGFICQEILQIAQFCHTASASIFCRFETVPCRLLLLGISAPSRLLKSFITLTTGYLCFCRKRKFYVVLESRFGQSSIPDRVQRYHQVGAGTNTIKSFLQWPVWPNVGVKNCPKCSRTSGFLS